MTPYIYSGAGNVFVVMDYRTVKRGLSAEEVRQLCRIHGTDGLMLLKESDSSDFRMEFFNPDGSGGMMCGNGGRCIAAFANFLGIRPGCQFRPADAGRKPQGQVYRFEAPDGLHCAEILSGDGRKAVVRLRMTDPSPMYPVLEGWFIDTGTRHFVKFVDDVESVDVLKEGAVLRGDPAFAPEGTNVNFVQRMQDGSLKVRTFEKGVEGETLACGTGVTAAALVAAAQEGRSCFTTCVHARVADLEVERYGDGVYLTGPAELVSPVTACQRR